MDSGRPRSRPWDPKWRTQGREPDYRFSLANERTFLAWMRSALALMAGGVLLVQFATRLPMAWLFTTTGLVLVGFAGLLSVLSYRQWRANEIAMRHDEPLPHSPAIPLLTALMVLVGVVLALASWRG